MKIQVIENMDGTVTVSVDGEAYVGRCQPGTKRVEGVRRSMTLEVEPVAEQPEPEAEAEG